MKYRKLLNRILLPSWALYLIAGNLFLATPIGPRLIAPHPERFEISWGPAWTVVPGLAHLRNLQIQQHTKDIIWHLKIKRACTGVNLLALPFKTFHALFPRVSGLSVVLEHAPTRMPPSEKTKKGFRILLTGISATGISSMDFWGLRMEGNEIGLRGTLDTTARGAFGIPRSRLLIQGGRIDFDGLPLARKLELDIHARIKKHLKKDRIKTGIMPFISAEINTSSDVEDLRFLDGFLRSVPWLNISGGSGRLESELEIIHGSLSPESRLKVRTSTFTFDYLDYEVKGKGTVLLKGLENPCPTADTRLAIELDDFKLAFKNSESPHIEGSDLRLEILGKLGGMLRKVASTRITLDIPESRVPDLSVYNRYLGEAKSFRLLSGAGNLSSHFEVETGSGKGSGSIRIKGTGIMANLQGRTIRSDLDTSLRIDIENLVQKQLSIESCKVELTHAGVATPDETPAEDASHPPWWCTLNIKHGSMKLTRPVVISLKADLTALDASPIFALIAKTRKSANRLDRILGIHDLSGTAALRIDHDAAILQNLHIEGGRAGIEGALCFKGKKRSGGIFLRYGILEVAVEIADGKEKKHIVNSRKWYEKFLRAFSCNPTPS